MDPVDALLHSPIFADVTRAELEALRPQLRERSFARGETVWSPGDAATALYVIARGQLKSYRLGRDGAELILDLARGGEVIGEVGVFRSDPVRLVFVAAMEPTTCIIIDREPLLQFMTGHPLVMRRMLASLSDTAVQAASALADLAFEDIRRRVARALVTLANEHGERTESGIRIRLKLSQTTLAALVAATRENVNRALAHFIAHGQVSQIDGFFVVHDRAALEDDL